jgi:hypothetical protein
MERDSSNAKGIIIKIVVGICLLLLIKFILNFVFISLSTGIKLFAVYCVYLTICIGLTWLFVRYSTSIVRAINLKGTPIIMFFIFIFISFKFGIYMYEDIDHQTPNAYFILMGILPFIFFAICGYNHTTGGKKVEQEDKEEEEEYQRQIIIDAHNPSGFASKNEIDDFFKKQQ